MCDYRSIETILAEWQDGNEIGWDAEFEWLETHHADRITKLRDDIERNGILEPILLGTDGRVWDGHHRLCVASALGIHMIPTRMAGA